MPTIRGARVVLRPLTEPDRSRVREILATPEVRRWWGDPDEETEFLFDSDPGVTSYVIEFDGVLVGVIQSAEETTPQYRHAGIDLALHPAWQHRGIGSDAIRTLARFLLDECGHHRLVIDPAAANEAAIRVYTRLGFRPVGVLRQYERGPDGSWHDGLLMDLLAAELE